MTAHHTPGPWYVGSHPNSGGYVGRVFSERPPRLIAQTVVPSGDDLRGHIVTKANARLIAEAPEMERVLRRLEYWFDTDEDILAAMSEADRADNRRNLDMIRAILARIDGDVK